MATAGGKWGSNSGRSRDTEQVNICPRWQVIAVRAVVGGWAGGGGVWLQMLQHTGHRPLLEKLGEE